MAASAAETINVVERLQDLQRDCRERFRTARRSALMLRIVDLAFERPVRSTGEVADALGVTYAGAANDLRELIAHGVAEEVEGTYPKLIRFPGVVEALGGRGELGCGGSGLSNSKTRPPAWLPMKRPAPAWRRGRSRPKVPAMRSIVEKGGGGEEGGGVVAGAGRRDEHPAFVLLGLVMGHPTGAVRGTAPPHHRRPRG